MTENNKIAVDIRNVTKMHGAFTALQNVNLDIQDNEFFTLLGPSGCGKITLLRTIAGFEDIIQPVGELVMACSQDVQAVYDTIWTNLKK